MRSWTGGWAPSTDVAAEQTVSREEVNLDFRFECAPGSPAMRRVSLLPSATDRAAHRRSSGKNAQFPLVDLIRQSIYRRLAGYEDQQVPITSMSEGTLYLEELFLALLKDKMGSSIAACDGVSRPQASPRT